MSFYICAHVPIALSSSSVSLSLLFSFSLFSLSLSFLSLTAGRLNWWTSTGRLPSLEPLATSGDGNCLLHAASLYMWGFHDHFLILRTALHRILTTSLEKEGLKGRWKYQTQLRNDEAGGLTFSEEEWEFEWEEILRIATNKPRQLRTTDSLRRYSSLRLSYESLEEIHIFALAHTLRRPIIVISDRTVKDQQGHDLAPIYFGGIYLPLELSPNYCSKSPVVLAFDSSHFSALVAKQDNNDKKQQQKGRGKIFRSADRKEPVIPLVTPDGGLLPIQFIYDPKKRSGFKKWAKMEYEPNEFPDVIISLLEAYLNVRWIQLKVSAVASHQEQADTDSPFPIQVPKVRFPAADMGQEIQPQYQKELVEKYLEHIKARYAEEKEKKAHWQEEMERQEKLRQQNMTVPCEGEGCDMFGRPATNNLCSVCYHKKLLEEQDLREESSNSEDMTGSGAKLDVLDYDREEEEDVADMHRRLIASTPSPPPPPYSEHVRRSPDHDGVRHESNSSRSPSHAYQYTQEPGERVRRSPAHASTQSVGFEVSPRRGLHDSSAPARLHSPRHVPLQFDEEPHGSGIQSAGKSVKPPMLPPKQKYPSPSHTVMEGSQVDSIQFSSSSVSPSRVPQLSIFPKDSSSSRRKQPLPLPNKRFSPPPEYEGPPSFNSKTKRLSPSPEREYPPPLAPKNRRVAPSPPEQKDPPSLVPKSKKFLSSSSESTSSTSTSVSTKTGEETGTKKWIYSPIKKPATPSNASGSRYTRDSIQPLHLDPMQQTSTGSYSQGTGSNVRKNCKTPSCEFFGCTDTDGYCSSCAKTREDDIPQSTLV